MKKQKNLKIKQITILSFIINTLLIFSLQSQIHIKSEYAYVNKESFKKIKLDSPEVQSLGYQVLNTDTLIKIENKYLEKFNAKRKRIRVPYEFKDSTFLDIYKNVVYRTHLTPKEKNKWRMKLWKDTLKVYFNNAVPKSHKQSLMKFADKVSKKVDSLNIVQVNDINDSNYIIYYIDDKTKIDYELAIENERAGYYIRWDGAWITKCRLKINTLSSLGDLEDMVLLKYYFFLSLGYFSYSNQITPKAYLSSSREISKLTEIDLEILKYHYSYGICKGTDLETFEYQHRKMKESLKENPNNKLYFSHSY
ncbi:hypothetical protein [Mesonia sp.]|uniref:hypothetical protein n=1 Tax=Mesonia sp. TaxID=1960830 RepID=UPI001762A964|nr:hypothetical protein [Mesonia sp.]HIB37302.1 hypothetical protein [Mesonia sp.]HIO27228.1 hypothetical protein [Flavobacteriaceae bacterium]